MIAVRVSNDIRAAIVGSPTYFKSYPKPKTPRDLVSHRCINFRHGHGGDVYRWEFEKGRKSVSVAVKGRLIVDDVELVIGAAVEGIGLAFVGQDKVEEHLSDGTLIRVLDDWCQPFPGFFLYYPSQRQQPALAALIDTLRMWGCVLSRSSKRSSTLRLQIRFRIHAPSAIQTLRRGLPNPCWP